MKEYRERKKQELGGDWLKKERERVKAYYTPTAQLTEEKKEKRREKNRRTSVLVNLEIRHIAYMLG